MLNALEALRIELDQEADTKLRVLQRVPRDRLEWRPHPRSMSLGQLALHVARIPAEFSRILEPSGVDFAEVDFECPGRVLSGAPPNLTSNLTSLVGGSA